MAVKVKLFGNLKDKVDSTDPTGSIGVVEMEEGRVRSISDILAVLGLGEDEVSHLFVNNDYSSPQRPVSDGDVVSIFPRNMALLYKWYFSKKR